MTTNEEYIAVRKLMRANPKLTREQATARVKRAESEQRHLRRPFRRP